MAELLHALERMKSSGQIERFDWPESVLPFLELRVYVSLDLYRDRDARRALRAEIYTLEQYGLPLMVVLQPTRADADDYVRQAQLKADLMLASTLQT